MKAPGKLPNSMAPTISPTEELSAVTLRKITWRLIPFLFVLYVIAWLDRVNVGFAGLQMNTDLGFSSTVFGLGSGIFFLGYCLFEIPSNIILEQGRSAALDRANHGDMGPLRIEFALAVFL